MKRIFSYVTYFFALILLLVLLLVGSVIVDSLIGGSRIHTLTNLTLPGQTNGEWPIHDVAAYVTRPSTPGPGPMPAIIMIHEFWGLQPSILSKADALAEEGYVVIAPDTYRGAVTAWLPRAIYLSATTPNERVNHDLDTVFSWLSTQPDVDATRVMVMGFCYGGTKALRYSLHNNSLAATGVFYGTLISDPAQLQHLPGPVIGIFGEEDQRPSPADVAEFELGLQVANIPYEVTIYPGVGHAFLGDIHSIRQDPTQNAAWQQFIEFARRMLQPS